MVRFMCFLCLLVALRSQAQDKIKTSIIKVKRIHEKIRLALLDPKETDPIWQGDLFLVDERIKDKLYSKVGLIITEELSRNKIPVVPVN